jgi:hypothetical protein
MFSEYEFDLDDCPVRPFADLKELGVSQFEKRR